MDDGVKIVAFRTAANTKVWNGRARILLLPNRRKYEGVERKGENSAFFCFFVFLVDVSIGVNFFPRYRCW